MRYQASCYLKLPNEALVTSHLVPTRNSVTGSDKDNWKLRVSRISLILFWACLGEDSTTGEAITVEQLFCADSWYGHM